jgi:hypothetical protein
VTREYESIGDTQLPRLPFQRVALATTHEKEFHPRYLRRQPRQGAQEIGLPLRLVQLRHASDDEGISEPELLPNTTTFGLIRL